MSDSNLPNAKTGKYLLMLGGIVTLVVGFYFLNFNYPILKNGNWSDIFKSLSKDTGSWGTFGDYVGGILNPLIAAFAFYLIARTYELQKTELEATRKLLEVSTNAQKDQIKLAALTAILNTNFTKLNLLESEYRSLLESEEKYPAPQLSFEQRLRNANQSNKLSNYREDKMNDIRLKIKKLQMKNSELENEIDAFSK